MLAVACLGGCDPQSPEPAPPTPEPAGVAGVKFDGVSFDFGEVTDTRTHEHVYTFTNTGSAPLIIGDISSTCGCTVPRLEKNQFAPGERGELKIVFDPKGRVGRVNTEINVVTNAQPYNVSKLTYVAQVVPLVRFDERVVNFGQIERGNRYTQTLDIFHDDPDLEVIDLRPVIPAIEARVLAAGEPAETEDAAATYRTSIEFAVGEGIPWGVIYDGAVDVLVRGRPGPEEELVENDYQVMCAGVAFGRIHGVAANPRAANRATSLLSLGNIDPGQPFQSFLTLMQPSGERFTITEVRFAETTVPGLDLRVEPEGPSAIHRVIIAGEIAAEERPEDGWVRGMVVVRTDVPGEEELTIRFVGLLKRLRPQPQ
jgi:hypothetical protein